jgi:hypothetical protein
MPHGEASAKLVAVMHARRLVLLATVPSFAAAVAAAGCGGGTATTHGGGPAATAVAHHTATAPPDASRPSAPHGSPMLVKLERLDGRFGRHDTLIVARDGQASLQLAHGGGGFRKAACTLDARSVDGLRRDLRHMPIDGRERPVEGYDDHAEHDGVIIARPPVYAVTYRGRFQVFGGDRMPIDGAPLAARMERILTAHEGRCHVTFQRP